MSDYKELSPEEAADMRAEDIDRAYEEARDLRDKEQAETSFLEEAAAEPLAQAVLSAVSAKAKRLLELKWDMEEKEEAYLESKKQYDEFRCVTLPTFMKMSGLDVIATVGGARVEVKSKYYCKPNKNEADMDIMEEFLQEHKMAALVKKQAVVETNNIPLLEQVGVPFTATREINTNSLKAWLKDQVGGNGGREQIKMEDIPKCMHFVRMEECEITT